MPPVSESQKKASKKYVKNTYDEIKVRVHKGNKEAIQAHAMAQEESTNTFINRAISEAIERDNKV